MSTIAASPSRLRHFLADMTRLLEESPAEPDLLARARRLLQHLVRCDDWLDDAYTLPSPLRYQQYLLYADPLERFSVVSFVWGPGQKTPIHNHTVWGLIGMLRGAEQSQAFSQASSGQWQTSGQPTLMRPGDVEAVSPSIGDVHQVCNAVEQTSVSIHVYGGNIGATPRSVFTEDGREASFISGYNNSQLPNLWDSSRDRTVNN